MLMQSSSIDAFSIEEVEKVYLVIKESIAFDACYLVVASIAAFLVIQNMIRIYSEAYRDGGRPDLKTLFELFRYQALALAIMAFLPTIITFVEHIMVQMQTGILDSLGGENIQVREKLKDMIYEKYNTTYKDGISIFDGVMAVFDFIAWVILAPVLYTSTCYMYGMFLCGRFMYLIMLEVVSPIAVILLLSEKTQQYFMTWCKHMMVCYLMVPFFFIANLFADKLTFTLVDGRIVLWFAVLMTFFLKLSLFKVVKTQLNNLL